MRGRCGVPISRRVPCGITARRAGPTRSYSRAGTRRRSRAACFSRHRHSKRGLSLRLIPTPTSISPSHNSMRRWVRRALASLTLLATAACARPHAAPQPLSGEPELRIGLAVGLPNSSIGGAESGELFLSEAVSGLPVGAVPAGVRWAVVPDSADSSRLRLMRPDGTRSDALRGIAVVNVTENRFVVANGRRYRGRINITSGRGGLNVVNRVGVESYVAGVVGPEIGARRPDELAAVLAQAIVSRSFALKNRGRWDAFGFDAYADTRDQVYLGVAVETNQGRDAAVGRRPAADHRRHGEPDDAVGTSRGATDRVRARRRPDPGAGRAVGAQTGGGPDARERRVSIDGHEDEWRSDAVGRGGRRIRARGRDVPVGSHWTRARGAGLPEDSDDVFPGDQN